MSKLSERHPEKQGLKPPVSSPENQPGPLSERHPEKQGLKHPFGITMRSPVFLFQSAIQKNKD